jgi:hypothetical protein
MRRLLLVLAVAALIASMVVATAAPAFAAAGGVKPNSNGAYVEKIGDAQQPNYNTVVVTPSYNTNIRAHEDQTGGGGSFRYPNNNCGNLCIFGVDNGNNTNVINHTHPNGQ